MQGFTNYWAYRDGKSIQWTKALDLRHKAGVPLTPCGIDEIKLLPDYQLVVVSGDHFNAINYKGPETAKPVYLYYHSGHYSVITSMPAFLGRAYVCLNCGKGYNTEDWRRHSCTTNVAITPRVPIKRRMARGSYALSVTECSRFLDVSRTINAWECVVGCPCVKSVVKWRIFLNEVKESTSAGKSDVLPVGRTTTPKRTGVSWNPPKKRKRKLNREGSDDEEEEREEEQKTNFLFFDSECMKETGVHVPNLVVVQDADGHEWVFKRANTCKDVNDWLFGGSMDGFVCIAHTFKGYDSYFILKYL